MNPLHLDLRALAAALHDAVAIALAVFAASMLLDTAGLTAARVQSCWRSCAVAIPLQVVVNVFFGLYQGVWRYTSLPTSSASSSRRSRDRARLRGAARAGLETGLGWREYCSTRCFLVGLMSLSRMAFRSFKEWTLYGRGGEQGTPVVIMGAGDAAVGLVKELSRSHEWRVVGCSTTTRRSAGACCTACA
jgi:FlaA1/EpsC-like NDP-sugar epimerase